MTSSQSIHKCFHFQDLETFSDNDFASVGGIAISVDRKHIFDVNIYHNHDYYELAYIRCGDGVQIINGISYTVTRGDVILFRLEDQHTYYSFNNMEVVNCCFLPDFLPLFLENDTSMSAVVNLPEEAQKEFETLLSLLHRECQRNQEYSLEAAQQYLQLLILILRRYGSHRNAEARQWDDLFRYISQNYRTVTLNEAANRIHLSKNYFCRTFHEKTGFTFMTYVNHIRITAAIEMISYTDVPITEVWSKVGFRQAKQFYALFKRETGLTPIQFRAHLTPPVPNEDTKAPDHRLRII